MKTQSYHSKYRYWSIVVLFCLLSAPLISSHVLQVLLSCMGLVSFLAVLWSHHSEKVAMATRQVRKRGQESKKNDDRSNLMNAFRDSVTQLEDDYSVLLRERDGLLVKETQLLASLKKLEQKTETVERKAKNKDQFLANVSHELRTPLNAIINFTQFAKDEDDLEEKNDHITQIHAAGLHLLGVVNDILDMSALEKGTLVLAHGEFSLKRQIELALAIAEVQANQKGVNLIFEPNVEFDWKVYGDGRRFSQILINLLGNAIKFNGNDGAIILQLDIKDKSNSNVTLELSVTDTGTGIPKHLRSKVFNAYERGESIDSSEVESTGLGLYITKQILELMGGSITLRSREGIGTRFSVTLPVEFAEDTSKPTLTTSGSNSSSASSGIREQSLRVLVVEDNRVNQKVLQKILESWGQEVQLANDGQEAVDKCGGDDFDIVLMDIQMPVMDGIEATKQIQELRKKSGKPAIPIIAVTAHALEEERTRYIESGMDGYVSKPLSKTELSTEIERCLASFDSNLG